MCTCCLNCTNRTISLLRFCTRYTACHKCLSWPVMVLKYLHWPVGFNVPCKSRLWFVYSKALVSKLCCSCDLLQLLLMSDSKQCQFLSNLAECRWLGHTSHLGRPFLLQLHPCPSPALCCSVTYKGHGRGCMTYILCPSEWVYKSRKHSPPTLQET